MLMIFKYYFLVIFLFGKNILGLVHLFVIYGFASSSFKSILRTIFLVWLPSLGLALLCFLALFLLYVKVMKFGRKDESFCCLSHRKVPNTMRIFISCFNFVLLFAGCMAGRPNHHNTILYDLLTFCLS